MNDYQDEFQLILHAGNAKSKAMMALQKARVSMFDEAEKLIEEANTELIRAHKIEKCLVVKEANGERIEIGILMIHAQDHLMGATLVLEEVNEFIHIYKELDKMKKEVKL